MRSVARTIHLSPRLEAAAMLLQNSCVVADIGCDHGRLICALLQRNPNRTGIAADIGQLPLDRAKRLAEAVGVAERISFRCGDGLRVLTSGEADAVALLGIGGTVMAGILDDASVPLSGAQIAVLQPMRSAEDIREYLYRRGYHMQTDHIIRDAGRLYQIFSVSPRADGKKDMLPAGWPEDCFDIGYTAYLQQDELLPELVRHMLLQHEKRLKDASGTAGEALLRGKADQMRTVLRLMGERI